MDKLKQSFLFHFVLVIGLCVFFYFLFFASLGWITEHGNEIRVPDVTGKTLDAAYETLEKMSFDVDVDSSYDPEAKPMAVLAQIPELNAVVKKGRTVFLTINKSRPPLTPMPKLLDLSYRSAVMMLNSSKLVLGDTFHKPDYAVGAVLEQRYNHLPIRPGDMVPQGSRIDLVIADGFGNVEMDVPDVTGMTAAEGMAVLNGYGLTPIPIYEADVTDSSTAVIYRQTPAPYNALNTPNRIMEGDVVDIRIKQYLTAEETERLNKKQGAAVIEDGY